MLNVQALLLVLVQTLSVVARFTTTKLDDSFVSVLEGIQNNPVLVGFLQQLLDGLQPQQLESPLERKAALAQFASVDKIPQPVQSAVVGALGISVVDFVAMLPLIVQLLLNIWKPTPTPNPIPPAPAPAPVPVPVPKPTGMAPPV